MTEYDYKLGRRLTEKEQKVRNEENRIRRQEKEKFRKIRLKKKIEGKLFVIKRGYDDDDAEINKNIGDKLDIDWSSNLTFDTSLLKRALTEREVIDKDNTVVYEVELRIIKKYRAYDLEDISNDTNGQDTQRIEIQSDSLEDAF